MTALDVAITSAFIVIAYIVLQYGSGLVFQAGVIVAVSMVWAIVIRYSKRET